MKHLQIFCTLAKLRKRQQIMAGKVSCFNLWTKFRNLEQSSCVLYSLWKVNKLNWNVRTASFDTPSMFLNSCTVALVKYKFINEYFFSFSVSTKCYTVNAKRQFLGKKWLSHNLPGLTRLYLNTVYNLLRPICVFYLFFRFWCRTCIFVYFISTSWFIIYLNVKVSWKSL